MKAEKDEFLTDGGKSAMMMMKRRSMADRSRLELRQLNNRLISAAFKQYAPFVTIHFFTLYHLHLLHFAM